MRAPPWLYTLSAHYSVISRATLLKGGRDQSIVMGQCFAAPFMNPGWLRKLSTVITHVNYTKMVAHIDPQRGFLHNVNGMMSKHCAALECMRGEKGRGGFGLSVGSRLFFFLLFIPYGGKQVHNTFDRISQFC